MLSAEPIHSLSVMGVLDDDEDTFAPVWKTSAGARFGWALI